MIVLLLAAFLSPLFGIDIGKINALKKEAEKAFAAGNYQKAAETYQYLADSMGVREDEVLLNLASARYQLADTAGASAVYRQLTASANRKIRSKSYQQLGVMASKQGKLEQAVSDFKQSLQADPTNQDARYNYELAARKLAEQKKKDEQQKQNKDNKDNKDQKDQDKKDQQQKQKDQQNKDKQKQDQQKKDQQEQQKQQQEQQKKEQEKKEKEQQQQQEKKENDQEQTPKQFDPERMKQMRVTEDKARMILDAMKNNEIQYLQQNKRKPTKPKDKNRPDW